MVLRFSHLDNICLKVLVLLGEFLAFCRGLLVPGAILAIILGFSLFKLGDLVDSRVGFGVLHGDAILTFVGGDVVFNISCKFL